jgi:hypothetical protein
MTLEDLLPLLEGVKKSKDHYLAICPAHPDKHASLSIKSGEKWLLTRCYAGCSTSEICAALGIKVSDLAYDKPRHLTGIHTSDDLLDTASLFVSLSTKSSEKLSVVDRAKLVSGVAQRLRSSTGGGS